MICVTRPCPYCATRLFGEDGGLVECRGCGCPVPIGRVKTLEIHGTVNAQQTPVEFWRARLVDDRQLLLFPADAAAQRFFRERKAAV